MQLERKISLWKIAQKEKKHTFMYKAVEKKKISAGIWRTTGRKVYGSGFTWRQVWRHSNLYGALRGGKNTNEHRRDKSWDQSKITFKLISSKNHNSVHVVISLYNFIALPLLAR